MSIVGAFDVHRRQLTFEYLDTVSGELKRGRVMPADRPHLRAWLARFAGQDDVQFTLEGCTGWRYGSRQLPARPGYGLGRPRKNERPQPPSRGTRSRIMSPEPGRMLRAPR